LKAQKSGLSFSSKSEALDHFKQSKASTYANKFDKEPTARPSHIPKSTTVDGKSYNVTYNTQYGGYGYMGPSGSWIMYDTMRDMAMLSMLMHHDPVYVSAVPGGAVVHSSGNVFGIIFTIIALVILGVVVIGFFVSLNKGF
jgi:hypothetical protein